MSTMFDTEPYEHAAAIVPNDATPQFSRRIYCGLVAGNLVVDTVGGEVDVVIPIIAGGAISVSVLRVKAATTATGLTRYW